MSRRRRRNLLAITIAAFMVNAALPPLSAAATWPPSSGLLVGEVVTGGAKGSDEWIELYNAGESAVELDGMELAYVTASGKTITRKQQWAAGSISGGGRLLLANAEGVHASLADRTYSGGLSATGGTLLLRWTEGEVIDSLSWGSAASEFVEGEPGAAPSAGASLERRPGDGIGRDTNDNAADTAVNASPRPEGQGSGPKPTPKPTSRPTPRPTPEASPKPTPEPTAEPTAAPTPKPTAEATPEPTSEPTPKPTVEPTAEPTPKPTVEPTAEPTAQPTTEPTPGPTAQPTTPPTSEPTPGPTSAPTPPPTPSPAATERPQPSPISTPLPPATPSPTPPASADPTSGTIEAARNGAIGARVVVTGTVTVERGRILGDRTIALVDRTGGIFVRLPRDGAPDVVRGDLVRVAGVLAAPYGNLEVRPDDATDIVGVGTGALPDPVALDGSAIGEAHEGVLATASGVIVAANRRQSGAVSIALRDDTGEFRVYLHAGHGVANSDLARGRRLSVVGLVGQRASRSGGTDGHRVWPRDAADVISRKRSDPGASPRPGDSAGPGENGAVRPPRKRIAALEPGDVATIVGVVTSKAGLFDGDGRRVTVEDKSGAILVRYPADARPHVIGTVIAASGEVGTWFDTLQLEASDRPTASAKRNVKAVLLKRTPNVKDEWSLVTVRVRLLDVSRSGDTWRAEAELVGGGSLPIAGIAGSRVAADAVEVDRSARITGIVRRAHPQATDQRFAIVPRSRRDIRLGARIRSKADDELEDVNSVARADDIAAVGEGPSTAVGGLSVTLASLERFNDRVVMVGGRLEAIAGRELTISDGATRRTIRLARSATPLANPLREGDIINVTGRVTAREGGSSTVVVASATDVRRAVSLSSGRIAPLAATLPGQLDSVLSEGAATSADPGSRPPALAFLSIIVGALATMALAGMALLLLRRRRDAVDG